MASSYISFKNLNIKANDFDLIFFVFIFIRAAKHCGKYTAMEGMLLAWVDSIKNDGGGNINLHLDDFFCSNQIRADFLYVFDQVKNYIFELPEEIEGEYLENLINIEGIRFGTYRKKFFFNFISSFDGILAQLK
jgi:hypothetical protein